MTHNALRQRVVAYYIPFLKCWYHNGGRGMSEWANSGMFPDLLTRPKQGRKKGETAGRLIRYQKFRHCHATTYVLFRGLHATSMLHPAEKPTEE